MKTKGKLFFFFNFVQNVTKSYFLKNYATNC